MVKGTTKTGFKFTIDERVLSDYRLLAALRKITSTEISETEKIGAVMDVTEFILGEQKEKLMKHVEKLNDGFCPFKAVEEEVGDIIANTKALKN